MSSSTSARYSSKTRSHSTLAAQLDVLRELVNLGDEGVERFRRKYPDFVPNVFARVIWTKAALEHLERIGDRIVSPRALILAETLKNSGPKAEELRARDILRLIWRGHDDADDYLKILLSGSHMRFDWKRAEVVYEPENEFERAIYRLFRNSPLAKVCGNPDCPAPLFIAQRRSQCYCGNDCAQVYQREWRRNWWKEKGSLRRQKQRARKRQTKKGGER